jgi:cytidyltransferase-like protein
MWDKKIHVKGTLPKKDEQYAMFIGRWQPLHEGHKQLFQQVINEGRKVLVAIRDVEPDEKNPWTAEQIFANLVVDLNNLITEGKLKLIIIPDICSVEFGRGVGYDIIEHIPPQEIHDISATKIREQMKAEGKL